MAASFISELPIPDLPDNQLVQTFTSLLGPDTVHAIAVVPVTPAGVPIPTTAGTSAVTSVASSIVNVTLLAANAARLGATIYNDSNSRLYVKLGAVASVTSFTERLESQQCYPVPANYTGVVDGIWAPIASRAARVTELSP